MSEKPKIKVHVGKVELTGLYGPDSPELGDIVGEQMAEGLRRATEFHEHRLRCLMRPEGPCDACQADLDHAAAHCGECGRPWDDDDGEQG